LAPAITFGPFRLLPRQWRLLSGDQPVPIGGRPLQILISLVEHAGELVTKQQLMKSVWAGLTVSDANLAVNIQTLRRVLGDGREGARYIVNIPGRGYVFVAPIRHEEDPATGPSPDLHNLPTRLTPLLGREATVRWLKDALEAERLVTIVGAGGIGKTAVALEVARQLVASYADGVWLVKLATVGEAPLVIAAVASALRLTIRSDDPVASLTAALRGKRLLLVLDNCEHLIAPAAMLAFDLLTNAPGAKILATSREPLGVAGEQLCWLPPLDSPPPSADLNAAEALAFPAVQLFMNRAGAVLGGGELVDEDAPYVAEICRRLDGIALAIEFAAARTITFGVRGLAAHLDEQWRYLANQERGAPPRHRTLVATLDWSHELLSFGERTVFRRLAIFSGSFTLAGAQAVVGDWDPVTVDITNDVLELVAKSLLSVDFRSEPPRYRLLETTRAYALDRLLASGEATVAAHRHAERCLYLLSSRPRPSQAREDWIAERAAAAGNIQAALTWAFSEDGETELAIALTLAAVPLWLRSNDLSSCQLRTAQAIERLDALGKGTALEMNLRLSFATAVEITDGPTDEVCKAFSDATRLARDLGDHDSLVRALLGSAGSFAWRGDVHKMRIYAEECGRLDAQRHHRFAKPSAEWMLGIALHLLGEFAASHESFQRLAESYTSELQNVFIVDFAIDPFVQAKAVASQSIWIQGRPDEALRMGALALHDSRRLKSPQTLCACLGWHATTILWSDAVYEDGTAELVDGLISELSAISRGQSFLGYQNWADTLRARLALQRADHAVGLEGLREALQRADRMHIRLFSLLAHCDLADGLSSCGNLEEALSVIDRAQAYAESEQLWCVAEVLRVRGLVLERHGETTAQNAEDTYQESLRWARRQGALSWELRTSASLAQLWRKQGRRTEARELVTGVYSKFSEGFETRDLRTARSLMEVLPG
jgi:predicted ATPase/DNA-binding winged helix-turn-helix (wHTH) protein